MSVVLLAVGTVTLLAGRGAFIARTGIIGAPMMGFGSTTSARPPGDSCDTSCGVGGEVSMVKESPFSVATTGVGRRES